jgi:hypothetical protein
MHLNLIFYAKTSVLSPLTVMLFASFFGYANFETLLTSQISNI